MSGFVEKEREYFEAVALESFMVRQWCNSFTHRHVKFSSHRSVAMTRLPKDLIVKWQLSNLVFLGILETPFPSRPSLSAVCPESSGTGTCSRCFPGIWLGRSQPSLPAGIWSAAQNSPQWLWNSLILVGSCSLQSSCLGSKMHKWMKSGQIIPMVTFHDK